MGLVERIRAWRAAVCPARGVRPGLVAVFGDVHANQEALDAVLADARRQGAGRFACTGDLVGYGADPSGCLAAVRRLGCPVVKGNHDEYAATDTSLEDFTLNAMNALLWTRAHLGAEERAWLDALPMEWGEGTRHGALGMSGGRPPPASGVGGGLAAKERRERASKPRLADRDSPTPFHLVHSSIVDPGAWHYIIKPEEAQKVLPRQEAGLVFFGHTHVPSAYAFDPGSGAFKSFMPLPEGRLELEPGWKWLANPGSVGQPRDRDPRAAYLLYDAAARALELRRVAYDCEAAAGKIVAAGLPERNAHRLFKGK